MRRSILYLFIHFIEMNLSLDEFEGWSYLTIHCRDNDNKPLDWWYIYKPPSQDSTYVYTGRNFTYITSNTEGKWQTSDILITASSMFQNTLKPAYRLTYTKTMAKVSYNNRKPSKNVYGTLANGVLMADDLGGLWMGHTVPDFIIHHTDDRPDFPEHEIENGHLIMCLSLDLESLNRVATYVNLVQPNFTYINIPKSMKPLLSTWKFHTTPHRVQAGKNTHPMYEGLIKKPLEFTTNGNTYVILLARPPGDNRCLYTEFAKINSISLNVFGRNDNDFITSICKKDYSVRHFGKITLKNLKTVHELESNVERSRFALSMMQPKRSNSDTPKYWTCTSNLDMKDTSGNGGMLVCLDDYNLWLIFNEFRHDNPDC